MLTVGNKSLVSAVITTYKRPPEIVERALKSIISQTYENIEIIIVDDSPASYEHRDEVKQMVEKYDGVKYIQHETNQGACVARNTGLANVKGEYIGYLDDDDEWNADKIEKQILKFDKSSNNTAIVTCRFLTLNENSGKKSIGEYQIFSGEVYEKLLTYGNFGGGASMPLMKTEALKSINGFDTLLKAAQDFDVWVRMSQKYNFEYVDEPLVLYHWHDGEQISKNPKNKIQGHERIIEKNKDVLEKNKNIFYARTMFLTSYYAMDGQIKKAILVWLKCVKVKPFEFEKNLKCIYRIIKYRKK